MSPLESTARYKPVIGPLARYPAICLVDSPRPVGVPKFRSAPTVQFRRIALDPAPDGDVINAQVPLGHHLFRLPEAQWVDVGFILRHFPQDYWIGPRQVGIVQVFVEAIG